VNQVLCEVKVKLRFRALNETPSQSSGISLAIWNHSVQPDTSEHTPTLTPARPPSTRFTCLREMEGWVDLRDWWRTEMV